MLGFILKLLVCKVGIHKWCWDDECIWSDKDWLEHMHQKYPRPTRESIGEVRERTEHIKGKDLRG